MSGSPVHLTVFLSSPGDVAEERNLARGVLAALPHHPLLPGKLSIRIVSWDDPDAPSPLTANETPQHSVNRFKGRPSECDLTIVILWTRLGTPLPSAQRKPDGSRYASGTEWEFEDAVRAGKDVLIYRRTEEPRRDDPRASEQHQALQSFFDRFRNPDGSAAGGYIEYASPKDFARVFEKQVQGYVGKLLEVDLGSKLDAHRISFANELSLADSLVGRENVFASIARFQTSNACGYFRLTADAGLGKTTLAAAVAKRLGAFAFFASRSGGVTKPRHCLNHLSAELIARFRLPYTALPDRAGEDGSFFEKILAESAAKASEPIWVVVDALDEAEQDAGQNALLLPRMLPARTFFFVTQRPGDPLVQIHSRTSVLDYVLTWDSPMQQVDVRAFLTREISRLELTRAVHAAIPTKDLVTELARLSEGNFMYLSYLLRDIAAGEWLVEVAGGSSPIPKGLDEYYAASWARMEEKLKGAGHGEWKTLYRPVISLLAVARESVTVEWLADLSGCDREDVQDVVLSGWRRYLSQERRNKADRWRIFHRSFGDFLAKKLDLSARHGAVARYYAGPKSWLEHDGYASRHLITHLRGAQDVEGMFQLLGDVAWRKYQLAADRTGVRYELDLHEAGALVREVDLVAVREGRTAPELVREIDVALRLSTLADLRRSVPPDTIAALVKLGILSDLEALKVVDRMGKSNRQRPLTALLPLLSETVVPRAVALALSLDPGEQIPIVLSLLDRLPEDRRGALLNDAIAAAQTLADDDPAKPELLCDIGLASTGEMRNACLQSGWTLAKEVTEPLARALSLAAYVGSVPDAQASMEAALREPPTSTDTEDTDDYVDETETLLNVVARIPPETRPAIARLAFERARGIQNDAARARALAKLVGDLLEGERHEAMTVARDAARAADDVAETVDCLLTLSVSAGEADRAALLREAQRSIGEIADGEAAAPRFLRLSGLVPDAERPAIEERAGRVLNEIREPTARISVLVESAEHLSGARRAALVEAANAIAAKLTVRRDKALALIEIALVSSDTAMRTLVREEFTRISGGLLAIGETPEDALERVELLAALANMRGSATNPDDVRELNTVAEAIVQPRDRARALASLLPVVDSTDRPHLVTEVRAWAQQSDSVVDQAELFGLLLHQATKDARPHLFQQALEAARAIEPGSMTVTGTINTRTGVVLFDRPSELMGRPAMGILRLAVSSDGAERSALIAEALESFFQHPGRLQPEVLTALLPFLSPDQTRTILLGYASAVRDPRREGLLRAIDGRLTRTVPDFEPEADIEADSGDAGTIHFEVSMPPLGWIFRVSPPPNEAINITYDPMPTWESLERRDAAERNIVHAVANNVVLSTPVDELRAAHDDAKNLRSGVWQLAIVRLLERIAATDSFDAAIAAAREVWPDGFPPAVVAGTASFCTTGDNPAVVARVLAAVPETSVGVERAMVWLLVAPHLGDDALARALADLMITIREIPAREILSILRMMKDQVAGLPVPVVLVLVQELLRAPDDRRDLLASLHELLPAIVLLGGSGLASSLAGVVRALSGEEEDR